MRLKGLRCWADGNIIIDPFNTRQISYRIGDTFAQLIRTNGPLLCHDAIQDIGNDLMFPVTGKDAQRIFYDQGDLGITPWLNVRVL